MESLHIVSHLALLPCLLYVVHIWVVSVILSTKVDIAFYIAVVRSFAAFDQVHVVLVTIVQYYQSIHNYQFWELRNAFHSIFHVSNVTTP